MGADGIKADPTKIDAINNMAAPYDLKSLQMVLGTFQFYARFINNYADLCKPLTRLLKRANMDLDRNRASSFRQYETSVHRAALVGTSGLSPKVLRLYRDASDYAP